MATFTTSDYEELLILANVVGKARLSMVGVGWEMKRQRLALLLENLARDAAREKDAVDKEMKEQEEGTRI